MMARIQIILIISLLITAPIYAQHSISGTVKDDVSGEPLVGAIVIIPDIKAGVAADINGKYSLTNLPSGKFIIEVKYLGYITVSEIIDLNLETVKDFRLKISALEAKGVVITGSALSSDNTRSSVSIIPIDRRELQSTASGNIINALSHVAGISQLSTGGAISKPMIRGLGFNRVVTINEGTRQEGNQWGDEHGIEIDQFSADRIEILKGPASLFYGSDAMGGVINILEPLPAARGTINGEFNGLYSGNNRMFSSSLMTEGNLKGWIWRIRGTGKSAANYQSADEYIYNSGFTEKDANLMLGVNKHWGYAHMHASLFSTVIGMIEGERDSATNKFVDVEGNIVPDNVLKGRKIDLPFQEISHKKFSVVSNIILGKNQLKIAAGYQLNDRQEFAESESEPGLHLSLGTATCDIKFQQVLSQTLEAVYGLSGMSQSNVNKGNEYLVPDFDLQDVGTFVYAKKSLKKLTFNAGVRIDNRKVTGYELITSPEGQWPFTVDTLFRNFTSRFSAISGSAGMTYKFSDALNIKCNIGRAFRAPNIAELASNGVHEGTFHFEKGNSNLKAEQSLQFDGGISYVKESYSFNLDAYCNLIDNFIYLRNFNNEMITSDSREFLVYHFVQGNSMLYGFEAALDIHPKDHFHFENSFSLVRAENTSTKQDLPLIPATHSRHLFRWNIDIWKNSAFRNPYVYVAADWYQQQNRVDEFESPTGSYVLYSAGAGSDFRVKHHVMTVFIEGSNLSNVSYYDHLSRLKAAGIRNMGRNISFGLQVPFGVAKVKGK